MPIFKTDEEKALVFEAAKKIREQLVKADIRVKVDEREGQSPGFKFNDWEMRGVPLRMEIGPKDVAKGSVVLARRDRPGKEGKTFVSAGGHRGIRASSCWRKFRRRCSTARWHSATRTRLSRRISKSSGRPWRQGFARSLLVRRRQVRRANQGRDQGHPALHPHGAARRSRGLHLLREAVKRNRHLREGLLGHSTSSIYDVNHLLSISCRK